MRMQYSLYLFIVLFETLFFNQIVAQPQGWDQIGTSVSGSVNQHFAESMDVNYNGKVFIAGAGYGVADIVKVYEWNDTDWTQRGTSFTETGTLDLLSTQVGIDSSGNSIIISYPFNDEAGNNSGMVKVFDWNGSSWIQRGETLYGALYEAIGYGAVCISNDGNTIAYTSSVLMGEPVPQDYFGYARIFHWSGSEWLQMGQDIVGTQPNVYFGIEARLSGNGKAFVVSSEEDTPNGSGSGMSRIFFWNGSDWEQKGSDINGLGSSDEATQVALDRTGNRLVQGAYENAGYYRIFHWNGSDWEQQGSTIYGSQEYDLLGASVSMDESGSRIVVSAEQSDAFANNGGVVLTLFWDGIQWNYEGEALPGITPDEIFGDVVQLSGDGNTLGVTALMTLNKGVVKMYDSRSYLSLNDLSAEDWNPSPNPNPGSFMLPEKMIEKTDQLLILDERGTIVATYFPAKDHTKEIELPLAQGVYTIVLYSHEGHQYIRKIVRI